MVCMNDVYFGFSYSVWELTLLWNHHNDFVISGVGYWACCIMGHAMYILCIGHAMHYGSFQGLSSGVIKSDRNPNLRFFHCANLHTNDLVVWGSRGFFGADLSCKTMLVFRYDIGKVQKHAGKTRPAKRTTQMNIHIHCSENNTQIIIKMILNIFSIQ